MGWIALVIVCLILWAIVDVRQTNYPPPGGREEAWACIVFFGGVFALLIGLMFVAKSNEKSEVLRAIHEAKEEKRKEVLSRRPLK